MLLDYLALVAKGVRISELHGNVTKRQVPGRPPPPGTAQKTDWNTTRSSSKEKPIYLSWSFSLRDRFQISLTSRSWRDDIKECKQGDTILAHKLGLATALQDHPERILHTGLESIFATVAQRTTTNLVWGPAGIMIAALQGSLYLHILKAATWRSSFQSA